MSKRRKAVYLLTICGVLAVSGVSILVIKNKRSSSRLTLNKANQIASLSADCITIQKASMLSDNGCKALKCASVAFVPEPTPHEDTDSAAQNLKACVRSESSAMIIGHGAEGRIDTGGPRATPDKIISFKNPDVWKDFIGNLKDNNLALTLLGCNVGDGGTGGNGVKLLKSVHEYTKPSKVRAPTGDVGCYNGQLYFEDNAMWQEVSDAGIATSPIKQNAHVGFRSLYLEPESSLIFPADIKKIILTIDDKPFPLPQDQKTIFIASVNFAVVKKS